MARLRAKTPVGARVRELREWSGFSILVVATQAGCSVRHVRQIENGLRVPSDKMLQRLADVLDCEAAELATLVNEHETRVVCGSRCNHHGAMRAGGAPALVQDNCIKYADCLGELVKSKWDAAAAHCQPNCNAFVPTPSFVRVQRDGGRRELVSPWDATDPCDSELPGPTQGARVKRLPVAPTRKGFFDYDRCTCSQCVAVRVAK